MPAVVRYGAAAVPLALLVAETKWRWLTHGGFRVAARAAGPASGADGSLADRIAFFRTDAVVGLVLLPLLFIGLAAVTPPRRRPLLVTLVAALLTVLFLIQAGAVLDTGTFLHTRLLLSALRFARERPEMVGTYIPLGVLARGLLTVGVVAAVAGLARRREAVRPGRATAAAGAAVLALSAAIWAVPVRATTFHRGMLLQALAGFVVESERGSAALARLDGPGLVAQYRAAATATETQPDSAWFGRARGADVVLLVLETVPARCLDVAGPLDDLPALAALRRRAFIAPRHYTTYPYSSLANFSLLSGWYPPDYARTWVRRHADGDPGGLLRVLGGLGYMTAVYEPFAAQFEDDAAMFQLLGAGRHVAPRGVFRGQSHREIAAADSLAIRQALADIGGWLDAGRRFVAVLLPQTSHAPWNDPPGRRLADPLARCRALAAVQDGWLGEIVRLLASRGRLEQTLLVVTADHGIRTHTEDPAFTPGRIDPYSFQVPFVLAAPGVLDSLIVIPVATSVIDVTPTLLDLLGAARDRSREQGAPIWDRSLAGRTLCLFAGAYFGANGCMGPDGFTAWNRITGETCSAAAPPCEPEDFLPGDSPAAAAVRARIGHLSAVRKAWLEVLVRPAP